MKTGKKLWSLLLALVMVVSLLGGAFVASAADSVTVTPDATYGGAVLNMTATKVDDQITVFDLASIGFGTGIEYAFWFEADGTFCFDQDVTLNYQGAVKTELKAGEVTGIAGYSECYLTLDDGNMIALIDKANPGNFASLAADTAFDGFPGTVSAGAAAAEEPAEEAPAEEPAEEEPAAEEPAEEAPAEGEAFVKTTSLDAGREYLVVTEYEGKYFALTCSDSTLGAAEVAVAGDAISGADDAAVWLPDGANHMQSKASSGKFIFAGSGGFMVWTSDMLRDFIYDSATETVKLHTKYWLGFDGEKFDQVTAEGDACKVLLFATAGTGSAEPAEEKPSMTIFDYPHPDTVKRAAVKNADGSITLAFTSDTHYDGANFNLAKWLEAAEAEIGYIDAMGFCGDMGSAYDSGPKFWDDAGAVMVYMDEQIAAGNVGNAIYTTGNHEWFPAGGGDYQNVYDTNEYAQRLQIIGEGLVTDDYIIYCFGAGESAGLPYGGASVNYKYYQDEIDYFAEYLETAPTDIPIFVLTHYPLHAWSGRGEFRYQENAAEIIDIFNEHPNLVVLWGHNHSDYDDNYYAPKFPGDEILIADGESKTINFTYLAAGCTADVEYTGPSAGSASVMNKGLIVTLNADGTKAFSYYTIDGQKMNIASPWLVRFRAAIDQYDVFASQYVEDGQAPEAVEAPAVEGYEFTGWYTWKDGDEAEFDFSAPITKNTLVTAKYAKILMPAAAPDLADCTTITPDATFNGESLTVAAAGVGDLITVFDLASIGYGTGVMYGFWFDADGVVCFSQNATLYYQGAITDFTLKAGEFYSVKGLSEHYVTLDDGNSVLLLEKENPGNYASLPGDQPYSAFPGAVTAPAESAPAPVEPEPAPVEPEPEPAPAPAPAPAEGSQTYTVKEGDSLRSISKEFYGTIFKWRLIYEANFDSMKGTDMIYVGQVLLIP